MSHTLNRENVIHNPDRGYHAAEAERDLVCFSHLRWDFVYQRPQHLLSRAGALDESSISKSPYMMRRGRAWKPDAMSPAF